MDRLAYGYSPNFKVWIKFTLHNTSNNAIQKTLEYGNPLTTEVIFYNHSDSIIIKDGLFNLNKDRNTLNPIFEINLKAHETKTFYLQVSSRITTLIVKLKLIDKNLFIKNETRHQVVLALFFGSMAILALYNLFIFFFTKDISYFYYVLYILGIIAHHLVYVGATNIYLLNQNIIFYVIEYASLLVSFPIFALALFTKVFLQTKQYPFADKILNILLMLLPITIIIFSNTDYFNKFRNLFAIILFAYILFITIYAVYKQNKQAYLILFGWMIIVTASILMF